MISGKQIRAARALLDISQEELAKATDLTKQGLSKIEEGSVKPRERTMEALASFFDITSIEFLENDGVRFRPEGMTVLSGPDGLKLFFDHVYAFAQCSGGIFRQNAIEDHIFFRSNDRFAKNHRDRMTALKNTRKNFVVRVLEKQGTKDFTCPEYAQYKWFSKFVPSPIPYYVYGHTVGIFAVDKDTIPRIYEITSPLVATTYARQFDAMWQTAIDPSSFHGARRKT